MSDLIEDKKKETFQFKQFSIDQENCSMKVGTDGILLGAWADKSGVQSILDIGTGTGLIALMLAQRTDSTIFAVEVDHKAWAQAIQNFQNCKWNDRLEAIHLSIQDYANQSDKKYDLITSNPPFFSGGVFSKNQNRANVRHTIKLPNGDLLQASRTLLSDEGKFCVILPFIEGLRFIEMAKNYGLYCTKMTEVSPFPNKKSNRLLIQLEKEEKPIIKDEFAVWEKENQYSKAFVGLTKDFYLNIKA